MEIVTEQAFRDDTDGVLQRAEAGETFVITRDGPAFAEIHPVQVERQRFVSRERLLTLVEGADPIDRHRFRTDLDAVVDPWFEAR